MMRTEPFVFVAVVLGCTPTPSNTGSTTDIPGSSDETNTNSSSGAQNGSSNTSETMAETTTAAGNTTNSSNLCSEGELELHGRCYTVMGTGLTDYGVFTVGDFNGDGTLDIVALGGTLLNEVVLLVGDGFGHFDEVEFALLTPDIGVETRLVSGHFDDNESLDLMRVSHGNSGPVYMSTLLNSGYGKLSNAVDGSVASEGGAAANALDINDDDIDDIVVSAGGGVISCLSQGNGSFSAPSPVVLENWCASTSIAKGTLDGDLREDLVVIGLCDGEQPTAASVAFNTGDGSIMESLTIPVGVAPWKANVFDMNNDQRADIIVGNGGENSVSIVYGALNGGYGPTNVLIFREGGGAECAGCTSLRDVVPADIDGDGDGDLWLIDRINNGSLIDAEYHLIAVMLENGAPISAPVVITPAWSGLMAADLNDDGIDDLVFNKKFDIANGFSREITTIISKD